MIKNLLKGTIIGIASILPGVSGGTMLVAMGIYDKLIHCINNLFSELKDNIKFLAPILIGALLALVGLSFIIESAFKYFLLPTNCLFIGLILGGVPSILENLRNEQGKFEVKIGYLVSFTVFFGVVLYMSLAGAVEGSTADLSFSIINIFKLFGVGIVAAATLVIPGVSGSMILLMMGYYTPIVEAINDFIKAALTFNMDGILAGFGVFIPAGLGVVFGVFAIAKMVEFVFKRYFRHAYWAITGLILSSPIGILAVSGVTTVEVADVIASVITLVIGIFVAIKLGD